MSGQVFSVRPGAGVGRTYHFKSTSAICSISDKDNISIEWVIFR